MSGVLKLFSPKKWIVNNARSKSEPDVKKGSKSIVIISSSESEVPTIITKEQLSFDAIFPTPNQPPLVIDTPSSDGTSSMSSRKLKQHNSSFSKKSISAGQRRKYKKLHNQLSSSSDEEGEKQQQSTQKMIVRTIDLGQVQSDVKSDDGEHYPQSNPTNPFNHYTFNSLSREENDEVNIKMINNKKNVMNHRRESHEVAFNTFLPDLYDNEHHHGLNSTLRQSGQVAESIACFDC